VGSAGPERRTDSSTVGDTSPRDAFSRVVELGSRKQAGVAVSRINHALSAKRSLSRVVERGSPQPAWLTGSKRLWMVRYVRSGASRIVERDSPAASFDVADRHVADRRV